MDPIKSAFSKIKEEINSLKEEIYALRQDMVSLRKFNNLGQIDITPTEEVYSFGKPTNQQTDRQENMPLEPIKTPNNSFSTGNGGVPTDRQTNQQTNQQTENPEKNLLTKGFFKFKQANELFNSLDELKKETAQTFKQLTSQELLVFTTLYQFENQGRKEITYRTIAQSLKLSESSIRDYITKLSKKGIPIEKTRENNKIVFLNIAQNLKDVVSLDTILALQGF
jgi:DNA-binding MarR family transcriptional regulator